MDHGFCVGCGAAIDPSWHYCETCGHPTGLTGAPAGTRAGSPLVKAGIALVLLGIVAIGIAAVVAIPNIARGIQRSKQKRTMSDLRVLGAASQAYADDKGTYPPYGSSIDEIERLVTPTYIETCPKDDGWRRRFRYHCLEPSGDRCLSYAFQSAGRDGVFEDLSTAIDEEARSHFDCDILYANGKFIWYPEGAYLGDD